jgi:hypothetical protein
MTVDKSRGCRRKSQAKPAWPLATNLTMKMRQFMYSDSSDIFWFTLSWGCLLSRWFLSCCFDSCGG